MRSDIAVEIEVVVGVNSLNLLPSPSQIHTYIHTYIHTESVRGSDSNSDRQSGSESVRGSGSKRKRKKKLSQKCLVGVK